MNTKTPNQALNRLSPEAYKASSKAPIYVVLDNVRSAQNVGSVFRSSDAFRCTKILLCGITAKPPHREINKSALGATESVEWEYFESTEMAVDSLLAAEIELYAVEQTSDAIALKNFNPNPSKPIALIFGNEIDGVQESVIAKSTGCIEIIQYGTKHSLNVAVCAGMALWHCSSIFLKEMG